jgi:hypothetical protein
VLLDRRFLEIRAERLDIGGDVQRLDVGELAVRVFLLRMVAAKNSRKRRVACSPASAMTPGTTNSADAAARARERRLTVSWRVGCMVWFSMPLV